MRYAVNLPNLGTLADPQLAVEVAVAAEEAGWDGVFVWDHILGWDGAEVGDAWVILSAMAQATSEIRRDPWSLRCHVAGHGCWRDRRYRSINSAMDG